MTTSEHSRRPLETIRKTSALGLAQVLINALVVISERGRQIGKALSRFLTNLDRHLIFRVFDIARNTCLV